MNLRQLTLTMLLLVAGFHAQAQGTDDSSPVKRSPEELRELLGPIALYPDPLVSLILPASTVPSDLVLAARAVKSGADPDSLQDKPWDSSVKGLTRYPDTLSWLDENLEWTTQVGDAFSDQPADVMEAIQDLRAKAKSVGNLVDTPQQRIVQEDSDIRILPAQPEYIYEPRYDPDVVYQQSPTAGPLLYFGAPLLVGSWLCYDFDWRRHHLYRGDWHDGWDYGRGGDRRGREDVFINNRLSNAQVWHVDSRRRVVEARHAGAAHVAAEHGHVMVPHPKAFADHVHEKGEVRRGEVMGVGRGGEPGHGKTVMPKGFAPGLEGEGRKHMESKGAEEPKAVHHEEPKAIHHEEPKAIHHEEPKAVHHEEPKAVHHEEPKAVHHEEPKAVHHEEPKAVHHDEPKVVHHEAPKVVHHEEPKAVHHEESKSHSDSKKDKKKD